VKNYEKLEEKDGRYVDASMLEMDFLYYLKV